MMLTVYLLVIAAANIQCSSLHRERRSLVALPASVTSNIDTETRRELLFLIVGKINATVKAQKQLIDECETKLNNTIDSCTSCQGNMCTPSIPLHTAVLNTIETGLNYPVVYAGKGIQEIGNWFGSSTSWMGSRASDFSKAVGSTANTVGNTLENTGNQALSGLGSAFTSLGSKFNSVGNTLASAAEHSLGGIVDLGQKISNLDNVLGGALSKIESSFTNFASNLGSSISNTATNIWDSTFGKLGRKKRCTNSCPMCDNLNTDTYTVDQITENVCGANTVKSREDAINEITFLQQLYNSTVTSELLSSIEYETNSIDFSGGTPAFTISFYYIDGVKRQFGGVFDMANQAETGKAIAKEYFSALLAVL